MVKVAVIGASGFTGEKLVELLLNHPRVKISYLSAKLEREVEFSQLFPRFKKRIELICHNLDTKKACSLADIFFLALPHGVSLQVVPSFLNKKKIVIDLSADYRLKEAKLYDRFYQFTHKDRKNLNKAVYGLPEFYKDKIKKAKLIANPGCYPTVSILSIAPLAKRKLIKNIIIDAKSAITGAGRKASLAFHYAHIRGNVLSYKPFSHQHLPEIEQVLSQICKRSVSLRFTPHIIPAERGILITVYGELVKNLKKEDIYDIYQSYYRQKPFLRILKDSLPQLRDVIDTNFCDIGFHVKGRQIVIIGVIDNLMKGASGQAVQNMNIILGLKEETGLR